MVKNDVILQEFKGCVGFRQTKDSCTQNLDSELLSSESGLYVNDIAVNWLTNENIEKCIEEYLYNEWSSSSTYEIDKKIAYQDNIYISLQDANTNHDPTESNSTWWQLVTAKPTLSTFLTQVKESAITELINSVLVQAKNLFKSKNLFKNSTGVILEGDFKESIFSGNEFRGYVFYPSFRKDIQLRINKIGIKVDQAGTLNIHVFKASQNEPIFTAPIVIGATEVNKVVWKDFVDSEAKECVLDYLSDTRQAGGAYYVGVFTNDPSYPGNIIQFETQYYSDVYRHRVNYFQGFFNTRLLKIKEADLNNVGELPTLDNREDYPSNALFNLDIGVFADHTEQILSTKSLWSYVIYMQVGYKLIKELYNSVQIGRIPAKASMDMSKDLGFILYGNRSVDPPIKGLEDELKAAKKDLIEQLKNTTGLKNKFAPKTNFY